MTFDTHLGIIVRLFLCSLMTNYAFQGVGPTLYTITALAIHLIKCTAKALSNFVRIVSTLKGGVSHFSNRA